MATTWGGGRDEDRAKTAKTDVLYCTDGLRVVQELTRKTEAQSDKPKVLVLDEVHEWNTNMEVLVAWAKEKAINDPNFKVVLMSATLDANNLAGFFGNGTPIIDVPGKLYPVEKNHAPNTEISDIAAEKAREGKDVLVFMPGKREIEEMCTALSLVIGENEADILPLHGAQDREDQQKIFKPSGQKPRIIVSTNIAQTSVTIPGIEVVVDSGVEKRIETKNGIEGLFLNPISSADCIQRAGRAGRTGPGEYILCHPLEIDSSARGAFPTPEIQRSRLDGLVLRLAKNGLDIRNLDFFHDPGHDQIETAFHSLELLGAVEADGSLTEIGKQLDRLPVDTHLGRMIIEAKEHGCLQEVITIASCIEAGGIRAKDGRWKNLILEKIDDDLLAELKIYGKAKKMTHEARKENGIFAKAFYEAQKIRQRTIRALPKDLKDALQEQAKPGDPQDIVKSCIAGWLDHMHKIDKYGRISDERGSIREIDREAITAKITPTSDEGLIVGLPFTISGENRRGVQFQLDILRFPTRVESSILHQIAPHLIRKEADGPPGYDPGTDTLSQRLELRIGRFVLDWEEETVPLDATNAHLLHEGRDQRTWLHSGYATTREYADPETIELLASSDELQQVEFGESSADGKPLIAYRGIRRALYGYNGPELAWFRTPQEALSTLHEASKSASRETRRQTRDKYELEYDDLHYRLQHLIETGQAIMPDSSVSLPRAHEIQTEYLHEWSSIARQTTEEAISLQADKLDEEVERLLDMIHKMPTSTFGVLSDEEIDKIDEITDLVDNREEHIPSVKDIRRLLNGFLNRLKDFETQVANSMQR